MRPIPRENDRRPFLSRCLSLRTKTSPECCVPLFRLHPRCRRRHRTLRGGSSRPGLHRSTSRFASPPASGPRVVTPRPQMPTLSGGRGVKVDGYFASGSGQQATASKGNGTTGAPRVKPIPRRLSTVSCVNRCGSQAGRATQRRAKRQNPYRHRRPSPTTGSWSLTIGDGVSAACDKQTAPGTMRLNVLGGHLIDSRYGRITRSTLQIRAYSSKRSTLDARRERHVRSDSRATSFICTPAGSPCTRRSSRSPTPNTHSRSARRATSSTTSAARPRNFRSCVDRLAGPAPSALVFAEDL